MKLPLWISVVYTIGELRCFLSRYTGEINFKVKYSCKGSSTLLDWIPGGTTLTSQHPFGQYILWRSRISNIFAVFLMGVLKGHLEKKRKKVLINFKMTFSRENPHGTVPSRSEDWTQWSVMPLMSNVQIGQNRWSCYELLLTLNAASPDTTGKYRLELKQHIIRNKKV